MIPIPGKKALRNPIFRGALDAMTHRGTAWTHGLNYAAVLSLALFITWPKEGFLSLRDLPFTYNAMGGTATIILAYLNFTQGGATCWAGRTPPCATGWRSRHCRPARSCAAIWQRAASRCCSSGAFRGP